MQVWRATVAIVMSGTASGCTTGAEQAVLLASSFAIPDGSAASEVVDSKGHRWRSVPAAFATDSPGRLEPEILQDKPMPSAEELASWTDTQWEERLRPIAFSNGIQYELIGPADEFVARLRRLQSGEVVQSAPSRGSLGGDNEESLASESQLKLPSNHEGGMMQPRGWPSEGDDRAIYSASSMGKYPARAVGALNGNPFDSTSSPCTMTLIGPSTAISAAHCFYQKNGIRGWKGTRSWSFGMRTSLSGQLLSYPIYSGCYWVTIPGGFLTEEGDDTFYDYAVIEFSNEQHVTCNLYPGNSLGWFGYSNASSSSVDYKLFKVRGYPSNDMPFAYSASYPWPSLYAHSNYHSSLYVDPIVPYRTRFSAYQSGGDSGASITQALKNGSVDPYVIAIQKGKYHDENNHVARRIDSTVVAFIQTYSAL